MATSKRKPACAARLLVVLWCAVAGLLPVGIARAAESTGAPKPPKTYPAPDLGWRRDGSLLAAGTIGALLSQAIPVHRVSVPLEGLDRSRIHWMVDRRSIRLQDEAASRTSGRILSASIAFPLVLSVLSAPSGERWRAPLLRVVPYIEATGLNQALTEIMKRGVSRPRPYLYLNGIEHPGAQGAVRAENAYLSFPSGHSSGNWCIVSFAITDHLLSRPRASWKEHAAVGFVGGALATYTGWLRVKAGQHFPSDVMAGAVVGSACGAGVPLLHRYVIGDRPAPRPTRGAWLGALGGTVAGVAAVLLLAPAG